MITEKLQFLVEDVDRHGNVRLYFRVKGRPKVRIREKIGTPEFHEVYQALLHRKTPQQRPDVMTWRSMCQQFFASTEFKRLAPRTQYAHRRNLEATFEEPWRLGSNQVFGDCPVERLEPQAIKVLRDRKVLPGAANDRLKAIRAAFSWGFEKEYVKHNKARDVAFVRNPSDGWHTWTREDWPIGSRPRLAMALMLYTGARRSDVIVLGRQHIRDGRLVFIPKKTRRIKPGFVVDIPILPELQEVLDKSETGDLAFIVTQHGRPFTPTGFSVWFRTCCDEAGLPECSAHGLRKVSATIMLECGASEAQVMAWHGWEKPAEVGRYGRAARRAKLADEAMTLLRRGKT
jgi:integrase